MDINKLLEGFLGSPRSVHPPKQPGPLPVDQIRSGLPGGLAGGAAAGGLLALLLGTKAGRKLGGKALKYGGMAVVAGLAYKAYQDWKQNKPSGNEAEPLNLPKPPDGSGFDVDHDRDHEGQDFRLALMRAVISAAKSDDHIDQAEHGHIRDQIKEMGFGAEEKAALLDYFSASPDPVEVAQLARTDAQRAELYLASALAVDPDTAEERRYLDELARQLGMPDGLRDHLDLEAAAARRQLSDAERSSETKSS
ncbi:tellurite resistance TerB family protein [Chelativorans xinjiangense]|uniref:tellurite resistance TerB family protein n=1 Tax=Chelativorans xinjiangense TaxID=2681485 RepID=UPI00135CB866|nr:tellurite resistance TerB family protein [Chelativorans xinjiangense]